MKSNIMQKQLLVLSILLLLGSCETRSRQNRADMIIINGDIMTMDSNYTHIQAIAIKDGKILDLGTTSKILSEYKSDNTHVLDAEGAFVMPGLIEAHGHFLSMGKSLSNLNLLHTQSWDEIVDSVKLRVARAKPGEWIFGRGWHQEKWNKKPLHTYSGYPNHRSLSAISPDNPVLLTHASGHALFANQKAMEIAGIDRETPNPVGGNILRFSDGSPIGVFEENAMSPVYHAYRQFLASKTEAERMKSFRKAVQAASANCLKWGITSFQDAGTSPDEYLTYEKVQKDIPLHLNFMLLGNPGQLDSVLTSNHLESMRGTISYHAIKAYFDGALGSYGAWLIDPYADKAGFYGQNTTPLDSLDALADVAIKHKLQFCVHAIGDRANREVLDLIEKKIKSGSLRGGHRWRIEHAQHIDTRDIPRFRELGVIASMQPIHCTSDAPFVIKRLGVSRAKTGAYAWRALLDAGAKMAIGTDVPVEEINPFANMYAAVTRKRVDSGLELFPRQAMRRREILYGYTIWNAYAMQEEHEIGSLTPGKRADIVILLKNLLNCKEEEILHNEVIYTILGGHIVYKHKKK